MSNIIKLIRVTETTTVHRGDGLIITPAGIVGVIPAAELGAIEEAPRRVTQRKVRRAASKADSQGLSPKAIRVLAALRSKGSATSKYLAHTAGTGAITGGLLRGLVRRGLAEKRGGEYVAIGQANGAAATH